MEFEYNGKIYKIKELKNEWKIVYDEDNYTLNIKIPKQAFNSIEDVKKLIIEKLAVNKCIIEEYN